MEINLTLLGQMFTFIVFVWFCMKFIWPPLTKAIADRQARIAEGLAASDKGKRDLELAKHRAQKILQEAKLNASHLVEKANKRAVEVVEQAKEKARHESEVIVSNGHREVEQMQATAKEALRDDVVKLSIQGAEKILQKDVDEKVHVNMLKSLAEQL